MRKSLGDIFYVYVIFDLKGGPLYVGKGKGERWKNHAKGSHNLALRGVFNASSDLPLVFVRENISEREAFRVEIALIAAIGRLDLSLGPLLNRANGGEGGSGVIQSDAVRKKHSDALKGRPDIGLPGRVASPIFQRGKALPLDILERMRKTKTGKRLSEDHRAKLSASRRGKPLSDAHKAAIARGNLGKTKRPRTSEEKAHLSRCVSQMLWWWSVSRSKSYRSEIRENPEDIPGRCPR
jgi:hypothetical protein